MNGLKLVNDVFGHQQGDSLLVAMAKVLRKACQPKDIVARWGGDEFLVILPQADKSYCRAVCERISAECNAVAEAAIPLSAAIGTATVESGTARLAELFNIAENRMYNDKLTRGKEVRSKMIASLGEILRTSCYEDDGHNERIMKIVAEFIDFLGMNSEPDDLKSIVKLAKLHDIGKVAIPKDILGKQGPLTPGEWEIVKSHSDIGYRMAQSIGEVTMAEIILSLHECWDGSGYPYGLKGDKIPLLSRIFALAEAYEVITHDRPYKSAIDSSAAREEIKAGIGRRFDPVLAKRFLDYLTAKEKP